MAIFKSLFRRFSIRQKLTLLIFSFILFTLLLFSVISYMSISRSSLSAGKQRVGVVAEQLAVMLSKSINRMKTLAEDRSDTQLIVNYLLHADTPSAQLMTYLNKIARDTNTLQLALYDAGFQKKITVSNKNFYKEPEINHLFRAVKNDPENARVGNLLASGDTILYPVIDAVIRDRVLLGYWVRWGMIKTSPEALEQLKNIMGINAMIFIGNQDGSLWTDLRRPVKDPPFHTKFGASHTITDKKGDSTQIIAASLPLQDSWQLVVLQSKSDVLMPAKRHLKWMALSGMCLLVLAFIASWKFSKRISKPILSLAVSSAELSAGRYKGPGDIIHRFDELGKLGRAFNAMAWQIGITKSALQKKAKDYQLLFQYNPLPMLISSLASLKILDVNVAAVNHYGYAKEEFLQMDTRDIRPREDIDKYLAHLKNLSYGQSSRGLWRHKKKDGSVIMVDIISNNIIYEDQEARLIMVHDVTEKLKVEAELFRNREMQKSLITKTTLQVQEREREEIGKELHDNINQILASARLYMELAGKAENEFKDEAICKGLETVNTAITEIRQLSKQLVSPQLQTSLSTVLADLTNEIRAITPININLHTDQFNEQKINDEFKLNIYRIIQEQVNNILKHAAASQIDIILETVIDEMRLMILDDGIGFDTTAKPKGIGLRNIDSRVNYYNGTVNLCSSPGKGTKLYILIPLTYNVR